MSLLLPLAVLSLALHLVLHLVLLVRYAAEATLSIPCLISAILLAIKRDNFRVRQGPRFVRILTIAETSLC